MLHKEIWPRGTLRGQGAVLLHEVPSVRWRGAYVRPAMGEVGVTCPETCEDHLLSSRQTTKTVLVVYICGGLGCRELWTATWDSAPTQRTQHREEYKHAKQANTWVTVMVKRLFQWRTLPLIYFAAHERKRHVAVGQTAGNCYVLQTRKRCNINNRMNLSAKWSDVKTIFTLLFLGPQTNRPELRH